MLAEPAPPHAAQRQHPERVQAAVVGEAFEAALAWVELHAAEPEPGAWDWAAEAHFHERVLAEQLAAAAAQGQPSGCKC